MDQQDIFRLFRHFRGSGVWAAKVLGVSRQTISRWLMDSKVSARLAREMPRLAAQLEKTGGKCINDVNGPSVRSKIGHLRRKGRKK